MTLLIAVILSSVLLSVTLALLDISYKQVLLASSVKQSQFAFYAADSAMECALYYDQQKDAFDYTPANRPSLSLACNTQTVTSATDDSGATHVTTLTIPCASGVGTLGIAKIYKTTGAATCAPGSSTCVFSTGYSSCNAADPRIIERGLKVQY